MSEPEIRPRIEDGVGWCDAGCSCANNYHQFQIDAEETQCAIDLKWRVSKSVHGPGEICPHHVRRMAALLRKVLWILGKVSAIRGVESGKIGTFMAEIISEIRALLGGE